ncbi:MULTISPECIES: polymorphic toxin type 33 domain-containing protein [unclassified Microcoleus]|uniref:polymorphic toxin type 33 domain-containing protein n=1 Tax=unclassified Microcoleus TaxID=2642155 RepID=UPI0025F988FE|nr:MULTISPECIES: polymorphic toxin type 33 domain-containing protein [unclassified Microcoleus]
MAEIISGNSEEERNRRQDKLLTKQEIERLKIGGVDIHEIKNEENASKKDLYKDRDGNIYVKPKCGMSPGEPTDLNINDF